MRLQQLEGLVALAEAGSVRAASKKLGISQPALTKSLKGLEEELGAALLQRTPRGVVLTDVGESVLQRARGISRDVRRLLDETAHFRGEPRGCVRIAVAPAPALLLLPKVLARMRRELPAVEIEIEEILYPAVLPQVRSGAIDLALGPQPPAELAGSDILVESLYQNHLIVAARTGHPLEQRTSLRELISAEWLLHGPPSGPGSLFEPAFIAHGLVPPPTPVRSTSFSATIAFLEASDALCVLSERLVGHLQRRHQLRALQLKEKLPAWDICLLSRAEVPLTSAARALATMLRRMPMSEP